MHVENSLRDILVHATAKATAANDGHVTDENTIVLQKAFSWSPGEHFNLLS